MSFFNIKKKKTVSCSNCGELGLHWEQDFGGKWKLFGPEGTPHNCPKRNTSSKNFVNWKDKPKV
jgi:hypothetical protein